MNSSQAPAHNEYAGDEINALVLDSGSSTTRAGFAGEDAPKSLVPSFYGVIQDASSTTTPDDYLFGENAVHNPRAHLEIRNPFGADSVVENWDAATRLWEYAITSRLTGIRATHPSKNGLNVGNGGEEVDVAMEGMEEVEKPMAENPLLMSEPGWNPTKAREKTMEVAMEDWGVPAFWMGKTGVLAAFASGKPSALVVDIGANTTSVTPLFDGLPLRKGILHSPLAGNFLSNQLRLQFAQSNPPVPLVPHFMVKSKSPVDANSPASASYVSFATPPSDSFRRLEEERVLLSFKESVVQVWQGPGRLSSRQHPNSERTNEDEAATRPGRPFEMPDGWNSMWGVERYKVVEGLFDHRAALTDDENPAPDSKHTLPTLIFNSLSQIDVDVRAQLLQTVILTGGGSLVEKMTDRLHSELSTMFPNPRVRVYGASGSGAGAVADRRYAAWVGGSVLGSLGSFHQMWISKKEYDEHGPGILEKRCK
ncbi:Actin-related protein 4 [Elasticomyces elasticus]|nr:Actin-related protein 4 [Elasticomyces elasticus]